MQTWLPYPNFEHSVAVLDRQRLNKQRSECKTMLKALFGETKGYLNHPVTQQWKDDVGLLVNYAWHVREEWMRRGYRDNMGEFIDACEAKVEKFHEVGLPWWFGIEAYHLSHQANLRHKAVFEYGCVFQEKASEIKLYPVSPGRAFDMVGGSCRLRFLSRRQWRDANSRDALRHLYAEARGEAFWEKHLGGPGEIVL